MDVDLHVQEITVSDEKINVLYYIHLTTKEFEGVIGGGTTEVHGDKVADLAKQLTEAIREEALTGMGLLKQETEDFLDPSLEEDPL